MPLAQGMQRIDVIHHQMCDIGVTRPMSRLQRQVQLRLAVAQDDEADRIAIAELDTKAQHAHVEGERAIKVAGGKGRGDPPEADAMAGGVAHRVPCSGGVATMWTVPIGLNGRCRLIQEGTSVLRETKDGSHAMASKICRTHGAVGAHLTVASGAADMGLES